LNLELSGSDISAKKDRKAKEMTFEYEEYCLGKRYSQKKVMVIYYVEENDEIMVITVKVFLRSSLHQASVLSLTVLYISSCVIPHLPALDSDRGMRNPVLYSSLPSQGRRLDSCRSLPLQVLSRGRNDKMCKFIYETLH